MKSGPGSEILQSIVKNFPHPKLIDGIKKILSYQRSAKYASQWNGILNSLKAKASTCKNNNDDYINSFSQAHMISNTTNSNDLNFAKKGTVTPNRNKKQQR